VKQASNDQPGSLTDLGCKLLAQCGVNSAITAARTEPCSPTRLQDCTSRKTARRDQLDLANGLGQRNPQRNYDNAAHSKAGANSIRCVIRHGPPIVRQYNAFMVCRPFEQFRIGRFAQARLMGG
jgi:hypothetical protein